MSPTLRLGAPSENEFPFTMAPLSSLSCLALANRARLTASQVSGRIALIVRCSTDFFGDQASGKRARPGTTPVVAGVILPKSAV